MTPDLRRYLRRRKKGLGVGFINHLYREKKSPYKSLKEHYWQEVWLPITSTNYRDKKLGRFMPVAFGLVFSLIFLVIFGRLWDLQVVHGQDSLVASQENRIRIRDIPAPRGIIYDRNGNILATSTPGFRLVAETVGLTSARMQQISDELSSDLAVPAAEIKTKLADQTKSEVVLQTSLTRDRALSLELRLANFPEVRVMEEPVRSYPNGKTMAHLLGYVGQINEDELKNPEYAGLSPGSKIGRSGIEGAYDYLLRGQDGKELVEVDAVGRTERVIARQDPVAGRNITLTVDLALTKQVEDSLDRELAITHSQKAAEVALDPRNGAVLVYISRPEFDPNLFSQGISVKDYQDLINDPAEPLFDRVLSGSYPPGSTFKPFIATAALSEGVTTKNRLVDSPGVIYLGTQAFHNWDDHPLGQQNIVDALAWSNDIYFYTMGGELGVDRIDKWGNLFGFGQPTGINLPGETKGNLPSATWKKQNYGQSWYPGDNYNLGIGQGFMLVSPLQMATALSAIANGGTLYQPILIKEVRDQHNFVVSRDNPVVKRTNIATVDVIQTVKDGLHQACTIFVKFPGDLACKTGTAEQGGSGSNPHGWFEIFAPTEQPEVVMLSLLEGVGNGSTYASPVTRPVFDKYIQK